MQTRMDTYGQNVDGLRGLVRDAMISVGDVIGETEQLLSLMEEGGSFARGCWKTCMPMIKKEMVADPGEYLTLSRTLYIGRIQQVIYSSWFVIHPSCTKVYFYTHRSIHTMFGSLV